jgi:hypothetical protein
VKIVLAVTISDQEKPDLIACFDREGVCAFAAN